MFNKIITIILIVFVLVGGFLFIRNRQLSKEVKEAVALSKSYAQELYGAKDSSRVFQMRLDQYKFANDSLSIKIKDAQKELKIKDKELESIGYIASNIGSKDSLRLKDTVFISPEFLVDTVLGDKWHENRIVLRHPNYVSSEVSFGLETVVAVYQKKETLYPRKRFFLARWFQRKQKILHVNVKENNPYVRDSLQRFIQILK